MLFRMRRLLAVVLIPSAFTIVTIVTTRKDVVLASEKIVGVAIEVGPRVVNEAKSV